MKKIIFFTGILAFLLTSACSKDEEAVPTDGKASIIISVVGGTNGTQLRSTGTPSEVQENEIKKFTVFVFENNVLEKASTYTARLTQTLNGLSTGAKKIVIVANAPDDLVTLAPGSNYSLLAEATRQIPLDDQNDLTNGLIMSGETQVTLAASETPVPVAVEVTRVVAKIILGSITIAPEFGYDPALFQLDGVAIINAKSGASLGIPTLVTYSPLYSGIAGPEVTGEDVKPYLLEAITKSDFANRYFYVFPNDNSNSDATLMALSATYDDVKMYFPFVIDAPVGSYIKRNTVHTVDVTLKRLGGGSPDPETPSGTAAITVTITPKNWEVVPVQKVEW